MIHRGRRWIMRFDLSDDEWALLEPLMPKSRMSARVDDRKIMNAIFYVLRTGMPWRDLPERYGPYTTSYNRFKCWSRRGIWKRIFDTLASKSRDGLYLIDTRVVKAHRAASGAKGGAKPDTPGRHWLLRLTRPTTARKSVNRSEMKVLCRSFRAANTATRKAYCPKRFYRQRTKSKTTSAATKTGDALLRAMTNLHETSLPTQPLSAHSTGSGCESRR